MELTINLPDSMFQQLRAIAELTEQPLNDLVLQSSECSLCIARETAAHQAGHRLLANLLHL